jgi:rare lipoprotein A
LAAADIGVAVEAIGKLVGEQQRRHRCSARLTSQPHALRPYGHRRLGAVQHRLEQTKVVPSMYRIFLTVALLSLGYSARAESGFASYYGGRGHKGEMTCAHRTRPLGTTVIVTYAGHSIQCRINDRGPFVRGRVIDVSVSAARALGMMRSGIVPVSVQ